jgi:yopX protein|nr:MAG TPA: YopX protein [Caudoviricetes sp.]
MRNIKYKAYIREYDKIVNVEQLELLPSGEVQSIVITDEELAEEPYRFTRGQFEPMEFIDLCDSKGIEIYTGNIVKIVTTQTNEKRIGEVIYYKGNAMYLVETTMEDYFTFMSSDIKSVEVLGNIYESKELLNE